MCHDVKGLGRTVLQHGFSQEHIIPLYGYNMVNLTNLLVDFHLVSLFFPIFYFIPRGHGYTYVWLFLNILFMYLCMYVSIYLFILAALRSM